MRAVLALSATAIAAALGASTPARLVPIALPTAATGPSTAAAAETKKRCRVVRKRIRGKVRKVRVCRNIPPPPRPPPPPPPPPPAPPLPASTTEIAVGSQPNGLGVGFGSLWIATRLGQLIRLDPATNAVTARIVLPGHTCGGVSVGFGAVWVAHCEGTRGLSRVDPETNRVTATIADAKGDVVGFGAGSVWAPSSAGDTVARIDPATNQVVARVPVGRGPAAVRFDYGAAWVTNLDDHSVSRVDPATNQVVATIPAGTYPDYIETGAGAVWVTTQGDRRLYRIDPATNTSIAIDLGVGTVSPDDQGQVTLAVGGGSVWVRGSRVLVSRIDAQTHQVQTLVPVGSGGGGLAVTDSVLWAVAYARGSIWRISTS